MSKSKTNDPFLKLNKYQQTLIRLDFEGNYTNKEIAPKINLKNETTISHWRKSKWYKPAYDAYVNRQINGKIKSKSIRTLVKLLDAKSEMVRYNACVTVLKMCGAFSENSNPLLDKAKLRNLNAKTEILEAKLKQIQEGKSLDGVTIQFIRSNRENIKRNAIKK